MSPARAGDIAVRVSVTVAMVRSRRSAGPAALKGKLISLEGEVDQSASAIVPTMIAVTRSVTGDASSAGKPGSWHHPRRWRRPPPASGRRSRNSSKTHTKILAGRQRDCSALKSCRGPSPTYPDSIELPVSDAGQGSASRRAAAIGRDQSGRRRSGQCQSSNTVGARKPQIGEPRPRSANQSQVGFLSSCWEARCEAAALRAWS